MALFDKILKDSESLFLDEIALDFEYIPKILKFRENEQQYIAICIKPLLQGRTGKNLFITGKPGIGKTAAIKWIFRDLEQETDEVVPIYINCWKKDTAFKIVTEICEQLGYKFIHNKRTDELIKVIADILNKKAAVFCFDEVDKLKEIGIIYSLLEDIYKKTVLLITNEESWLSNLDQRIKSRLSPDKVDFKHYNGKETEGILKQRVEHAFVPNIFEKEAFDLVSKKCFESQDIRTGLFLLKESGLMAENEASRKILLKHAKSAVSKIQDLKIKNFEDETEKIITIIKGNSGKTLRDMFDIYKKEKGNKSYRTFHRKISELKQNNVVKVSEKSKKTGGKLIVVEYLKKLTEF